MKPETYYSAVILFIAVFILVYGIITIMEPASMFNPKTKKIVRWKATLYAFLVSAIFTIIVALFSEKIESLVQIKDPIIISKNSNTF